MPWKLVYILDNLRLCLLRRSPTYAAPKRNALTSHLSLERA